MERQIADLGKWRDNLVAIAARGGSDFAMQLEAMGPQSASMVAIDIPIAVRTTLTFNGGNGRNFGSYANDQYFADGGIFGRNIPKNAYGNIYNQPTLGIFGEAGPEMILPLGADKRPQANALLAKSGLLKPLPNGWNGGTAPMTTSITIGPGAVQVTAAAGRERIAAREVVNELKRAIRNGEVPKAVTW